MELGRELYRRSGFLMANNVSRADSSSCDSTCKIVVYVFSGIMGLFGLMGLAYVIVTCSIHYA